MPTYITVTNLENSTVWTQSCTPEEARSFKNQGYLQGKSSIAPFKASLIVVRTHDWNSFSTDFFLPTTMNHAIKATTCKVIAIIAALILDILTFPVRLITLIPRAIYNARQYKVPLHKYLLDKGVDPKLLATNTLRVKVGWDEPPRMTKNYVTAADRKDLPEKMLEKSWQMFEQDVNLIEIPREAELHSVSGGGSNYFAI